MERKRIAEIRDARRRGELPRCFSRKDLRTACPGWPEGTYKAFLPKHCEGYAAEHNNSVLFARRERGVYVLIEEAANCEDDGQDPW
ncbi:MAG: hypothetical protein OXK79_03410, partial [Chloroflexota bacterium]|nr:hypothetical protein [Chloroflexota bacterium]